MIYQLKVTINNTKPPIWRRLQVDADTTFEQLHHILQTAFDWMDSHLHVFQTSKIPDDKRESVEERHDMFNPFFSSKNERAEIGNPEYNGWNLFFDEKQERLSEWLQQEKDRITYVYDFGDDWLHGIVLEKILPAEEGVPYPQCVKVRHISPEEDSRSEWLDAEWLAQHPEHHTDAVVDKKIQNEVNKRLREMDAVLSVSGSSAESSTDERNAREEGDGRWRKLFGLIDQYKRLQPWHWMGDVDMFAVVDPDSGETGYCCVLGEAGEAYGLAVYVGEEGFRTLIEITHHDQENPLLQRALLLTFENRTDLDKDDYRLIKDLGLSYRGRNAWPALRSFVPGYVPWYLEEWEIRFLSTVLEQVIHVCERVQDDAELIIPTEERLFARIPQQTGAELAWVDGAVPDSLETESPFSQCHISEEEMEHIQQSCPVQTRSLECDVDYFPEPVQDSEDERPYFPYLYLCVDTTSGMIVDQHMVSHEQASAQIQDSFAQLIQRMGFIPSTLHINNENTYWILAPLAAEWGIELLESGLPGIKEVKKELLAGFD